MGKIFCIMGKSSSGKDTIFKHIRKDKRLNLKEIVSYRLQDQLEKMKQMELNIILQMKILFISLKEGEGN